ncbi:uncharacterized protein LOC143277807 [Babylonia areolata]|uniref:uncharacterized protein LOC143277807 n=1 Tax=Babylonia areolata TaxID=304850 RepID=UPI003FD185F1
MFVLGDYQYENFLNHLTLTKVHPEDRPFVVEMLGQLRMEQQFGDFDLLVLHPQCGLMVFGLCSVNSNSDVQYILKRVQKARAQLEKSVMVAQRFVATLGLACPVTHVFCTPNLKRSFLSRVVMRDKVKVTHHRGNTWTKPCRAATCCAATSSRPSSVSSGSAPGPSASCSTGGRRSRTGRRSRKVSSSARMTSPCCWEACCVRRFRKWTLTKAVPPAPSESRPLILENAAAEPNPSMDTVPGVEPTKWPQKEFDVSGLYLSIGSVTKPFASYMEEYVDLYYPHYLTDTYRVPPIHFNIQKITREGAYDLLELPMSKDKRGDEGENRVVGAVEILGLRYPAARPAFIICDFQYNNYLNKLKENMFIKGDDRRPRRAYGQSVRAQHDCLLIHRRYGIIIISVKAVGDNFKEWASTGSDKWQAVKRTLRKVLKQLPREQTMVNMVLSDLTPTSDLPCIKLVALPNLSHSDIDTAVSDDEELKEDIKALFPTHGTRAFLCKDELCEAEESIWETYERCPEFFTNLCRWWDRSVGPGRDDVLSEELYKQIIGRFCGLLSTVEVWSAQSPRVEVRNLEEAVQETAERYARIVLTREQLEILHRPTRRVFLSGPPGTGKTMLLVLRAQRWVEEEGGGRAVVVVLNLRHGSAGLSLGHLLQKQVTEMIHASPTHPHHAAHPHDSKDGGGGGGGHSPKHQHHHTPPSSSQSSPPVPPVVKRVDYNSCMFDEEQPGKLGDIPEGAYIVVDEVDRLIHPVLKWVLENRKPSALWCAGQFQESCPEGFEPHRLDRILRCPPMVQRVLEPTSHYLGSVGKETRARSTPSPSAQPDLSEQEKHHYVFSSTPQGLSTDGARPLLIFHSEHHNSPSRLPAQCSTCGSELGDHLLATLHLQTSTVDQAKRRRLGPLPTTTGGGGSSGGVSMRDVVIVCNDASPCPLVTALKKRGLTVSIVTDTANPMVAMPTHDTVVFTTPQAMKGLERKVVVYIPSEAGDQLGKTTTMTSTLTATTMKGGEEREEGESGGGGGGVDDLKVRQALEKLTADDKVMLWYTASRCLSQLVIIVP